MQIGWVWDYIKICFNIINYMQERNSFPSSDSAKMSIETTFQLRRWGVSSTCVSVEVDFSPAISSNSGDGSNGLSQKPTRSIPVYNKDGNYFTPSFILQMDKNKYIQNQHIYQTLFEKKIEQMDQQKTEMYLPKPSKTNSFCCVCKTFFDDYLAHVTLPMHRTLMEKSEFHAYIQEICGKFSCMKSQENETEKKRRVRQNKTKPVAKEPKKRVSKKGVSSPTSMTRIPSYSEMLEPIEQC